MRRPADSRVFRFSLWRWLFPVIPAKAGIQESLTEQNTTGWQWPLDSGPVSEYGVTFFRRNDGKPKDPAADRRAIAL